METEYLSFTSTWLRFAKEGLVIPPNAKFNFGCSRSHVLGETPQGEVPMEVSWANPQGWKHYHQDRAPRNRVSPDILAKWEIFRDIVSLADEEGRVLWAK